VDELVRLFDLQELAFNNPANSISRLLTAWNRTHTGYLLASMAPVHDSRLPYYPRLARSPMHVGERILVHTLGGTGGCQRRWISRVTPLTEPVDRDLSCPIVVLTCFARIINNSKSSHRDRSDNPRSCSVWLKLRLAVSTIADNKTKTMQIPNVARHEPYLISHVLYDLSHRLYQKV
jgi:hypothetical protein